MHDQYIRVKTVGDDLAIISLVYPTKGCYLFSDFMEAFCKKLSELRGCRIIIIKSEGESFCEGIRLDSFGNERTLIRDVTAYQRMLHEIHLSNSISIAAVHGSITGAGAGLMAVCDFVVATNDTLIGFPDVRMGIIPSHAIAILNQRVNLITIKELLLRGEYISAIKAQALGLINYVVEEDSRLMPTAIRLAEDIILGSPRCVVQTKQIINTLRSKDYDEDMRLAMDYAEDAFSGSDLVEGLDAMLNHRNPSWYRELSESLLKNESD